MFRKVSTLLVLATSLAVGACDDEIVDDAIPVSDAAVASDAASEAIPSIMQPSPQTA